MKTPKRNWWLLSLALLAGGMPEQQLANLPMEHSDPGHTLMHWLLETLPGGVWTLLGGFAIGGLVLVCVVFRKKVVPILEVLVKFLGGK